MKLVSAATFIVALATCMIDARALRAQSTGSQGAFSHIELSAGGLQNVGESEIHEFWERGYGGELSIMTPFYLGDAELGAALHRYDVEQTDVPRFDAMLVFVGWGFALEPIRWISWYNGFRLGNTRMTFDEETFPGVKNESEFLIGGQSRLTIHLYRQTGIFAAAQFNQTYTNVRFRTVYLSAGLSTRFSTPSWLKTFLR